MTAKEQDVATVNKLFMIVEGLTLFYLLALIIAFQFGAFAVVFQTLAFIIAFIFILSPRRFNRSKNHNQTTGRNKSPREH